MKNNVAGNVHRQTVNNLNLKMIDEIMTLTFSKNYPILKFFALLFILITWIIPLSYTYRREAMSNVHGSSKYYLRCHENTGSFTSLYTHITLILHVMSDCLSHNARQNHINVIFDTRVPCYKFKFICLRKCLLIFFFLK